MNIWWEEEIFLAALRNCLTSLLMAFTQAFLVSSDSHCSLITMPLVLSAPGPAVSLPAGSLMCSSLCTSNVVSSSAMTSRTLTWLMLQQKARLCHHL